MPDTSGAGQVRYDCAGCGPVLGAAFAQFTTAAGQSAPTCQACYTRGMLDGAFLAKLHGAVCAGVTVPRIEALFGALGIATPVGPFGVAATLRYVPRKGRR